MKIYNFIYLIPFDGIGGVEVAARTLPRGRVNNLNIDLRYIFYENL